MIIIIIQIYISESSIYLPLFVVTSQVSDRCKLHRALMLIIQ